MTPKIEEKTPIKSASRGAAASREYELLKELFELLGLLGINKQSIAEITKTALRDAHISTTKWANSHATVSEKDNLTACSALFKWHREKNLLTSGAKPKALRLTGKNGSVESILRSCDEKSDARALAKEMLSLKYIRPSRRRGYFLPASIHGGLMPLTSFGITHCIHSLRTFIRNFHTNISRDKGAPFLERRAIVQEFPIHKIQAFKDLTMQQGSALIATFNEWLERQRCIAIQPKERSSKKTTLAGIHVFAFTGN